MRSTGSPGAVGDSDADERLTRVLRRALPGREAGVPAEGRSDHSPLADAGIAVGGFYTGSQERGPVPARATRAITFRATRSPTWTGACCCTWPALRPRRYAK